MSLAALSLAALFIAVLVSCVSEANIGVLAIALAWLVGVVIGGGSVGDLVGGFPSQLFLTLVGVTLFFGQAQHNGTLERLAHQAVRLCRGNRGLIPIVLFVLTLAFSSVGPGNIAAAALMVPLAMGVAGQSGISAFLMAIMVGNGASAGSLSPLAPAGIVVNGIMADWDVPDAATSNYVSNVLVHAVIGVGGYLLLGGWRLFGRDRGAVRAGGPESGAVGGAASGANPVLETRPFERQHWITIAVMAVLLTGVLFADVNVGMGAFAGAVVLTVLGAADERGAIATMPWRVILMVTGVTVLVAMLERTGGMELFVAIMAGVSTPVTVTGVSALFSGVISIYSSTSGVVLPALIPMVPGLVERLGSGDLMAVASAINVGGHLVDLSPFSTLGALCVACAPASEDSRALFNRLLAWGVAMAPVGALVCWVLFGVLGLA